MNKNKMIESLSKSNGEFTKRAITDLLDQAMSFIRKEVKKIKNSLIQHWEHLKFEREKRGKEETHKPEKKFKLMQVRRSGFVQRQLLRAI